MMRMRFDRIRLGSQLAETERAIEMNANILSYSGADAPITIDEQFQPGFWDATGFPFMRYYCSDRYAILVYYEPRSRIVTGKELLVIKNRSLRTVDATVARRLFE